MPSAVQALTLAIFDLDGTLIDSVTDLADAVDEALVICGLPPAGLARVRNWVGEGARVLLGRALNHHFGGATQPPGLLAALETAFNRCYRTAAGRSTTVYPGVPETLRGLAARGVRLACVTNKPIAHTLPLLKQLRLLEHFPVVLGGDSLPLRKPQALPLEIACIRHQTDVSAACMVGDSIHDLHAANSAGMCAIAVAYGYGGDHDLALHAEAIIPTMSDLIPNLQQLGRLP